MSRASDLTQLLLERIAYDAIAGKKNIDLAKEYQDLNKKLWGGYLPAIKLLWNNSKRTGGFVKAKGIKKGDFVTNLVFDSLQMSAFTQRTYQEFLGILAHEMIHVYLLSNGYNEAQEHGPRFMMERDRVQQLVDFTIPVSEDITNKRVSDDIEARKMGLVMFGVMKTIQVYSANKFKEVIDAFKKLPAEWLKGKDIKFYYSTDKELLKYPTSKKVVAKRGVRSYHVDDNFFSRLEKESEYVGAA